MERDRREEARARRAARKTRSQQSVKPESDTELPSSHSSKQKSSQLQMQQTKPPPPPPPPPPQPELVQHPGFSLLFVLCQVVALACVAMVYLWTIHYGGGFGTKLKQKGMFNWHPLIMTFAFTLTQGNTVLFYRAYKKMGDPFIKYGTLCLYCLTGVLTIAGMATLAMSYNPTPKSLFKFYSLHGWLGFLTIVLYIYQFIVAVFGYGLEIIPKHVLNGILPSFVYTGLVVLGVGCVSGTTGVLELAFIEVTLEKYSVIRPPGILLNIIGTTFVFFACFVSYAATYKKKDNHQTQSQMSALTTERSEPMKIQ